MRFKSHTRSEIAARWSRVWGDRFPGHARHSADAIAGAVTYYIRGQDLKFSFDVTHLNGAPITSEDGTFRAGDDGYLFRFQFQWLF